MKKLNNSLANKQTRLVAANGQEQNQAIIDLRELKLGFYPAKRAASEYSVKYW